MHQHRWRKVATAALLGAMVISGAALATPAVSNGGAPYWVAFDPSGRALGNVQFMTKRIMIVNTSSTPNAFTIFYEPSHTQVCAGTLAPGAMTLCGVQSSPGMSGGYFQVIAAQPVLMGGSSDTAYMNFTQDAQGRFGADPAHGVVISVQLNWQEGCPPRPGSGCPDGRNTIEPSRVTPGRAEQMR